MIPSHLPTTPNTAILPPQTDTQLPLALFSSTSISFVLFAPPTSPCQDRDLKHQKGQEKKKKKVFQWHFVCKEETSTLAEQVELIIHLSSETLLPFHKNKLNKSKSTPKPCYVVD